MTFAAAVCGAFLAVDRFAFAPTTAKWVAFGVAIGATVLSLGAAGVALIRVNHAFSGLSALAAAAAAWTVIAMLLFATPTAVWLAFAGGLVVLAVSVAALAVHETTVERVVYALEGAGHGVFAGRAAPVGAMSDGGSRIAWRTAISPPARSWAYWLAHTALAVTGAFIVLLTFAYRAPGGGVSLRWLAFAIAIAAACVAVVALTAAALSHGGRRSLDGTPSGRLAALLVSLLGAGSAVALIVTMPIYAGTTARWLAFALGCGIAGASLLALTIHEITSERVRHELEVAQPIIGVPATAAASAVPSTS
jgi:hypothetical protein